MRHYSLLLFIVSWHLQPAVLQVAKGANVADAPAAVDGGAVVSTAAAALVKGKQRLLVLRRYPSRICCLAAAQRGAGAIQAWRVSAPTLTDISTTALFMSGYIHSLGCCGCDDAAPEG